MSSLTLVSHHLCPYVQRAVIALTEKGVAFERLTIDLAAKPEWFRVLSPLGKVPLLKVARPDAQTGGGEAVLFESAVICEYIEETQAGPALHPADAIERAEHRAWIEYASSILSDIYALYTAPDAAVFETKRQVLARKFARLEEVLGGIPFFAGTRFSLVDAAFGPVFRYFDVFDSIADLGILSGNPKVAAWRRALADHPPVRSAVSADYPERLWHFLGSRASYLRTMMQPRAGHAALRGASQAS